MPKICSKTHGSWRNWLVRQREDRDTCLLLDGIDSDAIAHMNADAEFKPPPHKRKIDENQTNCSWKVLGNAP